ncbi:MAG: glycyl-radical enzyme activating protein [Desulfobacterales bacterium]|nr:glycyl-radical enzyme activating protein [Desulfobacterales bacterium]MBS3756875.1 glycyl-radical enzyme activating protein [Desulfobacterales bacterium]
MKEKNQLNPGRKQPLILEIKGNALDDGPGIRSVVFFKGCPLSCAWCHNPESKRVGVEIGFEANKCVGCDTCIGVCPENALSRVNPFFVDRTACSLCFQCVKNCPSGALERIGRPMAVEDVVATVVRDKSFYDTSGGGVTLSGGEPTLFMDYTADLLRLLKAQGIHTLVETCGLFDIDAFTEKLLPWIDTIYFDIKIMDPADHKRFCGASNETILKNFKVLHEWAQNGGAEVLARTPLIPDITDTPENLEAVAAFLKQCGADKARLLPYHPLWKQKKFKIGIADPAGQNPKSMDAFQDETALQNCRSIFETAGITL